jgi:hypothetical protein
VIIFLEKIINILKNVFLRKLPINAKYYSEKAYQSVKEFLSSNK